MLQQNIQKQCGSFCEFNKLDEKFEQFSLKINYPNRWFSPIKLSPFAQTIEDETIAWMDKLGLIKHKGILNHIRAMEPRHYAGYTHPLASYEHALLYCKYITMWLLWDDECVENATNYQQVAQPLLALAGEQIATKDQFDPYVIAFKHIGDEYEKLGASKAWRQRFAEKMMQWANYAIDEEKVRTNSTTHSFAEALQLRSFTVGIRPNTLPLERAVGIEVPDYIHQDQDYEQLLDKAALICCIVNDLVGVAKDLKNNQIKSNLILFNQMQTATTLAEAHVELIRIHDNAVLEFDSLANILLSKTAPNFQKRLATFFDHLRYMDSGFGFWHQDCVRYQQYLATEGHYYFKVAL